MSGMTNQFQVEISDHLTQVIGLSQDLLTEILFQIQEIENFTTEREVVWNKRFSLITSDISQFVEITTLWAKLLRSKYHVELPVIKDSHTNLLILLKGINQAQIKSDAVVLDDLIKHELKDNLTQWKINIIPQMKKAIII